jgi:uncharacterized protein (TIGR03437 family)
MKKLLCYLFVLSAMVWGQAVSPQINQLPTRQFGHPITENLANSPTQASPNLVIGQEVDTPGQIAFDNSSGTPILYIADIGNNRVLAYKNPAGVTAGKTADLVIGQQDMVSTVAQGPGSALSTGLNAPTGVAVDSQGRLYVADAGNNRIMRFPTPFATPGVPPTPDLVIGQQGFGTGNSANEGGNCSAKTLYFANGANVQLTSLAIDSSGNLWTTDPGNNRVLMYPVANLSANAVAPVASVVLGQNNFTTCTGPGSGFTVLSKGNVVDPSGLAFDATGNLYVTDAYARVLFFTGPTFAAQGQTALRVLGIPPPPASGTATVYPTQYTLGNVADNQYVPPNGVFTQGNHLYVADTPQHRIVEYDIPSNWAAESTAFPSPAAVSVVGQNGFNTGAINMGQAQPSAYTFESPYGGAFVGTQMWVSDTGNNRILAFSVNAANTYSAASVLIGQLDYKYNAPNLIVGSEVFLSGGLPSGAASGIVVDNSSNPPHLYVADPGNNRILCFNSALSVGAGPSLPVADMVIGQPDLKTSEINYPGGMAGQPTQMGLYNPIGVAVDNTGNLYVADYGNGRVVRFPAPFSQAGCPTACATQASANLVLGQASFTSFIQNASANSMHSPWGVALFADVPNATPLAGSLAVSDPAYNRILIFKRQASGDFTSGESASIVLGQSSFSGTAPGTGDASFSAPRGIASDTSDRLYVADSTNGRILEFIQVPEGSSNPTSTNQLPGLNTPYAVAINSTTTELWAASTNSSYVYRFPEYNTCQISCAFTAQLASYGPLGLAVDASGNVIVGDASNRVTFFYAQMFFRNAANFNTQPLAPGMLAIMARYGLPLSIQSGAAVTNPWPTTLADINVTVNGTAAPVFATVSNAVYFQVPYEAPTSGTANFIITQNSTGAVIGVGSFQMAQTNPGFFTVNAAGNGPVAATNSSGPINSSNPAARGSSVTFYLTGLGVVPGVPPDGLAPTGPANAPNAPTVIINGAQAVVSYSGPGAFAGGWQINATVPMSAVPNSLAEVVVQYLGVPSNIVGTTGSDGPGPDTHQVNTITLVVGN